MASVAPLPRDQILESLFHLWARKKILARTARTTDSSASSFYVLATPVCEPAQLKNTAFFQRPCMNRASAFREVIDMTKSNLLRTLGTALVTLIAAVPVAHAQTRPLRIG